MWPGSGQWHVSLCRPCSLPFTGWNGDRAWEAGVDHELDVIGLKCSSRRKWALVIPKQPPHQTWIVRFQSSSYERNKPPTGLSSSVAVDLYWMDMHHFKGETNHWAHLASSLGKERGHRQGARPSGLGLEPAADLDLFYIFLQSHTLLAKISFPSLKN